MTHAKTAEALSVESLMAQVADDYLERLHRGERPDVEEYAARHSQIAVFLRQTLPALALMHDAASGGGPAAAAPEGLGTLGDFRLLRQIGRGGMGIVYEAEQVSLGR